MKASKIEITAINDIDGAGFRGQQIEGMDIGQFAVRNVDEA